MNLREGRIGNQEAVAVTMLAAVLNTVFVTEGQRLYHSGNQTYLSVMASAALSLIVFLLAARAMAHRGLADLAVIAAPYDGEHLEGFAVGREPWVAMLPFRSASFLRMAFSIA